MRVGRVLIKSKTASLVGKTTFWPFGLLKSDAILANIRFGATPGYHCGRCDGRRERMGGGLSVGQLCLPRTSAASQAHALENALANGGHHRGRKLHAPTARGLRLGGRGATNPRYRDQPRHATVRCGVLLRPSGAVQALTLTLLSHSHWSGLGARPAASAAPHTQSGPDLPAHRHA